MSTPMPDGPFMDAMVQRTNDIGFSAPLMNQEIAAYLLDHCAMEQLRAVNAGYRAKSLKTRRLIDRHLGPYLEACDGGSAGFYFYLTFSDCPTVEGSPFFNFLARTTGIRAIDGPRGRKNRRMLYIPGSICVHPRGELAGRGMRQLRISYGFEEPDRIEEGIGIMGEAVAFARERQ